MRGATSITLQPHQILRLPRKMTLMIDVRHTWHVIYNARSNRSHPPTSPSAAPATQNDSHHLSSWHMKRHLQCAEQQASPSNLTKYCACHAKWLSWLMSVTHDTSFTMRGATDLILQHHQALRLPRKMTRIIYPRDIWNVIYNARRNRHHLPTSPNTAPATQNHSYDWSSSHMKRHLQCAEQQASPSNLTKYCACHAKLHSKILEKLSENSWSVIYNARPIRAWSEHDPSMIRPWTRHLAPARSRRLHFVLRRRILYWKLQHFALRLSTQISPNTAPATKSDTPRSPNTAPATKNDSHDWYPWHMKRHLQCAEQQASPCNLTKYCACHAKWLSWLIFVTYGTSFTMRGATGITLQPHQILRLPRKSALQDLSEILRERLKRQFQCAADSTMIRAWSEHDPSMIRPWTRHLAPARSPRLLFALRRRILYWKLQHFALRPSTQISPNTVPATKNDTPTSPNAAPATKSDTPRSPNAAPATKSQLLLSCYSTELLLSCYSTELLLNCYSTELLLNCYWTELLLNCYWTELNLLLKWAVTELLLKWAVTELFVNWAVTELLLKWAVTELLLKWAVTELFVNWAVTELLLNWAVTELLLKWAVTELLLNWAVTEVLLNWAVTELILNWAEPVTQLSCYWTVTQVSCYWTVTQLSCYWTVTQVSCYWTVTQLSCYWTVTQLSWTCYSTELLLKWAVTELLLNWAVTELLLKWAVIELLLNWAVTELLLNWAEPVTQLSCYWTVTQVSCYWTVTQLSCYWTVTQVSCYWTVTQLSCYWTVTQLSWTCYSTELLLNCYSSELLLNCYSSELLLNCYSTELLLNCYSSELLLHF